MRSTNPGRPAWPRLLTLLIVLAFATGALAACGSDDDDGGGGGDTAAGASDDGGSSTAADEVYARYSAPVEWPGPDEPVDPPPGKRITIITCGSQGITCVRVANGAEAAAKALGYEAEVVDGRSQPTVWNQAIRAAVADKADGIVLAAVPPALTEGALDRAKAANIPVAAVLSVLGPPVDVRVNIDRPGVARANSAWIAEDSGGEAEILMVRDDEFPETKITTDSYPDALAELCPGCEIAAEVEFTLAIASQRLAGDVAQALQQNPGIDYIVLPFDTVNPFVVEGIRQAGKTGDVKIIGLGADPPSFDAIQAGDQAMSLGTAGEWQGWSALDGLVRIFAGAPVPPFDEKITSNYDSPLRYVTADTEVPGPEGWSGGFDYQAKYEELWGH